MARYQVILAYDGTHFLGFQRQARRPLGRTIQGEVEDALRRIGWTGSTILAAGRTDTGVHAAGQVISFDLEWPHPCAALLAALNANLPPDVAARSVQAALAGFHPRYAAVARRYRYRLYCQPVRDPLQDRYAWRVWPAVSLESLQPSAAALVGTHDFAAFGTPPRTGGSTIRSVFQAGWQAEETGLIFEITANAFLYHMVRRLVYAQVAVGLGRMETAVFQQLLDGGPPALIRGLAPPQGLALVEVTYPSVPGEAAPALAEQAGDEPGELSK